MNDPQLATREVLWNINHVWLMYALLVPTVAVAGYGIYLRVRNWRRGLSKNRLDRPLERLGLVAKYRHPATGTWRRLYPGSFHAMIFWGFIVLTIATTVVMLDYDFGIPLLQGRFYLYFQSLVVDLFGAAAIVGTLMAAARRWFVRPKKLVYTFEASAILIAIFLMLVTGFLVEGWRIAQPAIPGAPWSPIGNLVATASENLMTPERMQQAHAAMWWTHMGLVFAFIAWAPYTKMAHILTSTLNIYAGRLKPIGALLEPVNFETEGKLGIDTLAGFTWKDLLDFDACTECGRCTAACPANRVGKVLSPRDIILDLQARMHAENGAFGESFINTTPALSAESMWECTTCGACVEACPVSIEQMPKIVDTRRFLVMEEADFPETMQAAINSLETRGHPLRGTAFSRVDWGAGARHLDR